jgi:hypothetical protein
MVDYVTPPVAAQGVSLEDCLIVKSYWKQSYTKLQHNLPGLLYAPCKKLQGAFSLVSATKAKTFHVSRLSIPDHTSRRVNIISYNRWPEYKLKSVCVHGRKRHTVRITNHLRSTSTRRGPATGCQRLNTARNLYYLGTKVRQK